MQFKAAHQKLDPKMKTGAYYHGNGKCEFIVWGPFLNELAVRIISPKERLLPMERGKQGYWHLLVNDVSPGARYFYRLDRSRDRPDPASFSQPDGVHEASEVVEHNNFQWQDEAWPGIPLEEMIIYELHVGTFTPEGTFEAIIQRLDELRNLGVNTIELMPITQFPGERNWGYDVAYPFAVQNSYGGPQGLKKLVNLCHERGFSVVLDVVYNHLGPEGNYLHEFGPYFTEKYKTPWGKAINFDGPYSDEVRSFFIQNTLYWLQHYHIDALRLDAIHGIFDMSAKHILEELAETVEEFSHREGRKFYLIAESDLNDVRVIRKKELGGYGIDAQWCDDFHHSVHTLLTSEATGYYADFGKLDHLVKSLKEGFVYSGEYSQYRKRRHGSASRDYPASQFIVCIQNHDQVGNRLRGERLSQLVPFEALKLAAGVLFVSPYVPLLFMGEEHAEDSPFMYFVSHTDENLIRAIREGRKQEFESFQWHQEPPDPQSIDTFLLSKIKWQKRKEGKHKAILEYYRALIKFRKGIPALAHLNKNSLDIETMAENKIILLRRWHSGSHIFCVMNLSDKEVRLPIDFPEQKWALLLDSSDTQWMGPGTRVPESVQGKNELILNPYGFVLYETETPK
jgi:maltooligosyltrehalose trehalohydrolase